MTASGATPTGVGTTGKQWWPADWAYFVMPESLKELFRSDGTAHAVVRDSNIVSGLLLSNGVPRYPILISLAAEAMRDEEIGPLTNYVAAGGFLFVGSSSFTRHTNGVSRGNFALAAQMGINMVVPGLTNWGLTDSVTKQTDHRLVSHLPAGELRWRMPASSDEISWGTSPTHSYLASHEVWRVQATTATVLSTGLSSPYLLVKPYGKGWFIYYAPMQPLIGHGGFAPTYYSYLVFRKAVEWAFETALMPVPKVSPWPFQYDAAFMVRHDLENYTNLIADIEASARFEYTNGARGDYYFCTGTVREDATNKTAIISGLRRAMTNYQATICPHNGGLRNPNNPALLRGDYDYWHWGPDEALDVTPAGYSSGKEYASNSLRTAFLDIEGWLPGLMTNGMRVWCSCYFNATREDSYDLQEKLNVKITGDQKLCPFPHWTISTRTPNKRYAFNSQPPSDWFINGRIAQSLEPWHYPGVHSVATLRTAIDAYYDLGALINFYSHTLSTGQGDAGSLASEYVLYGMNTNLHPRLWSANAILIRNWWVQRSNVTVQATFSTNGLQSIASLRILGSSSTNTAVEWVLPHGVCNLEVQTNGAAAGTNIFRLKGQTLKVRVGTAVTNVVLKFYPLATGETVFAENFDAVTPPGIPPGWATSASGAQSPWVIQDSVRDTVPNAAYTTNAADVGLSELVTPPILVSAGRGQLVFRHSFDLEPRFDGGVLEMKLGTNGFVDILSLGGSFVSGGYREIIDSGYENPLAGRQAWSGDSLGFITTTISLPELNQAQTVQLRWRCGTDNGVASGGWWIDSVSIVNTACQCCGTTNQAPILGLQTDRIVAEHSTLTVTNQAVDPDVPPNSLIYGLLAPPPGCAISQQGIITWTPTESQGPSTNLIRTVVTDNGSPPRSATNVFQVVVAEVNAAPELPGMSGRVMNEMAPLVVTNTAVDLDLPAQALSYELLSPPVGMTINAIGIISWSPTEAQGPGIYTVQSRVVDSGTPPLARTNSFQVQVNEVNAPPTLPAQTNRTVAVSNLLSVLNTAADTDLPANILNYSLTDGPAGAAISSNGVISWMPVAEQAGTTNLFLTVVTDGAGGSASNSFSVVVPAPVWLEIESCLLVTEGCQPTNGVVDPGETVSIWMALKNTGFGTAGQVSALLVATNGVTNPGTPQDYGNLAPTGVAIGRPFSFTAGGECGRMLSLRFEVSAQGLVVTNLVVEVPLGVVTPLLSESFDGVAAPALPPGWSSASSNSPALWATSTLNPLSAPNSVVGAAGFDQGSSELTSPPLILGSGLHRLSFRHATGFAGIGTNVTEGGVVEIRVGTNDWSDLVAVGGVFQSGAYNASIPSNATNPLAGRAVWGGTSAGYILAEAILPPSASGQTAQLRWRLGTDGPPHGAGWSIDDVRVEAMACCVNQAPQLPVIAGQTVSELSQLRVTNQVLSAGMPQAVITYELGAAPPGAAIDTNGVITWIPAEEQGPGTFTIQTIARNGTVASLAVTNSFQVTVAEQNRPPSLVVPIGQITGELTLMALAAQASDEDWPPNGLTFSLNGPSGMTIDSQTGALEWTPSEAQGPSSNWVSVVVTDSGNPPLSVTNGFSVEVLEINSAPLLTLPNTLTIPEMGAWLFAAQAFDGDIPSNVLNYALSGPEGMSIDPGTGWIHWTPTEAQGPSTNLITVVVSDNGNPAASTTNSIQIVAAEVNVAPVLPLQSNRTNGLGVPLIVTNAATDTDIPSNVLSYSLAVGPTNAAISSEGVISWTPSVVQSGATHQFRTVVADGAGGFATNSFNVFVPGAPQIVVSSFHLAAEAGTPTNGVADPGEWVNVVLTLTNRAGGVASQVVASLLSTNGVTNPSGSQDYGPMVPAGPSVARSFVFQAQGACGQSITGRFLVAIDGAVVTQVDVPIQLGVITTHLSQSFDSVTVPSLPTGWTTTARKNSALWETSTSNDRSPPNSVFGAANSNNELSELLSPSIPIGAGTGRLRFRHAYGFQGSGNNATEGGVLEIQVGSGAWADILDAGGSFAAGGYTGVIDSSIANSLAGRPVWAGSSGGSKMTEVMLPSSASGNSIRLRWRVGTDGAPHGTGWYLDDILVDTLACTTNQQLQPPVLGSLENRDAHELVQLSVTNSVLDGGLPPAPVAYELLDPPAGASIDGNGVLSWAPSEIQGPGIYSLKTVARNGLFPFLAVTNSFEVVVSESNTPPVLTVPAACMVAQFATLQVQALGSDSDWPPNTLTFALTGPEGMTINPTNGLISWTPGLDQGPSTNVATVMLSDNGAPGFMVADILTVIVTGSNTPPVLTVPGDQTLAEGTPLLVNAVGIDNDLPINTLTFSLSGPAGMAIDPATGAISWTPSEVQGPSSNLVTVVVTDNGVPAYSASNTFTVAVLETNTVPVLGNPGNWILPDGQSLVLSNAAVDADWPANNLTYGLLSAPEGAGITAEGVITWMPPTNHIAISNVFQTVVTDDGVPALSATNRFVVFFEKSAAPVITHFGVVGQTATLEWTALPGRRYRPECVGTVDGTNWAGLPEVDAISGSASSTHSLTNTRALFYRVILLPLTGNRF